MIRLDRRAREMMAAIDRDEQMIRSLVQSWMEATLAGDLPRVLERGAEPCPRA